MVEKEHSVSTSGVERKWLAIFSVQLRSAGDLREYR